MSQPSWLACRYGDHPAQVADLAVPSAPTARPAPLAPSALPAPSAAAPGAGPAGAVCGVAVLLHGGYWRARYDRTLQHAVAADLLARGWAVWNVDYRAVPPGPGDGGGWPRTQQDVAAGVDLLAAVAPAHGLAAVVADPRRVVVVGHSAGGCLALWTAARHLLPAGAPGAAPVVRPGAVIAQAAICDLVAGVRQGLGGGAVEAMMGALPRAAPAAYALASPAELLPTGVPTLLVTGADDEIVPPVQSLGHAERARAAGDVVRVEVVPGEGHFGHLDPTSASWRVARSWLADRSAGLPAAGEPPPALRGCGDD